MDTTTRPTSIGRGLAALMLTGMLGFGFAAEQGAEAGPTAAGVPAAGSAAPDAGRRPHLTWSALPDLPEALGVAGPFAGVSGGALLVAGGANFPNGMPWAGGRKVWHDAVYVLPAPAGAWQAA
ncbi:MAG: hypothetical protein NTV49_07995, partial [Kiritimatiellaeota bacterium]|nr:hypothetical protein [Kiritimatiellota bacterium]